MNLLYTFKYIFSILFLNFFLGAIENECGSQDIQFNLNNILLQNKMAKDFVNDVNRQEYWAPIMFHVVTLSNGEGGIPSYRLEQGINDLNVMYHNAGIHFYQHQLSPNYINEDIYYSIDDYEEANELRLTDVVDDAINIYIISNLAPGSESLCGLSSFVDSEVQGILMAEACFALPDNPSTLSHEVGHYFNLLHTHTGSSDSNGDGIIDGPNAEFVDGTECSSRGDDLCDTPADPLLSDIVNSQCEYSGSYIDGHGDLYQPDVGNLMSYSEKICRNHFSDEQNQLAVNTLLMYRPELNIPPSNPNINLYSYNYETTEGDGDSVLNPGDSFDLTVFLENIDPWPSANNISIVLTSESNGINIINQNQYLDILETGIVYQLDSFEINISDDIALGTYDLDLNINCSNESQSYNKNFEMSIPISLMQQGFPYDFNGQIDSSPLIIDFDQDGSLEIIFGTRLDSIHVLSDNIGDFAYYTTGDDIWSSAASADIDLDGFLDFAITSIDKNLYTFNRRISDWDDGLKFSYNADQSLIATPSIGNIDGDDELEIVFGAYESSSNIFAINHDGSNVEGFPVEINEKIFKGFALHDLNNNGLDDIVFATDGDDYIGICYDDGSVDTLLIAGNKFKTAPSILKINNNKHIIMAGSYDDNMYAVSPDGEFLFQVETGGNVNSSASFVSLNGEPYAFFGSDDDYLYAVDMNGVALEGWPQNVGDNVDNSVSFADLDGDGEPEAIIGVSNRLYVFHMDGNLYERFPITHEFSFTSNPTIKDLDGDGDLEITIGSTGELVSIDFVGEGGRLFDDLGLPHWNQGQSGEQRRGFFFSPMMGDFNSDSYLDLLDIIQIINVIINAAQVDEYQIFVADINQDQNIDVLDAMVIVNLIIN